MNSYLTRGLHTLAALSAFALPAWAGTPYPTKAMPAPQDAGSLSAQAGAGPVSATLVLKLRNAQAAEQLLQELSDPGSAKFRQFLTPQQFKAAYGASDQDVAMVGAQLAAYGLSVERSGASTLHVSGSAANMERAFQVRLHQYNVPATAGAAGFAFQAPTSAPTVPAETSAVVDSVIGLSTRPRYFPHHMSTKAKFANAASPELLPASSSLINPLGSLTVADFSKYYNVLPLANKGITGAGRTLGIVTLASFTQSDAVRYWKAVGLSVAPNRISVVNIDGGSGAPSDASGSDETTLDVEQSGGIAPGAKIIVYEAPNTDQGFIDAFVTTVESNKAESISTSWGEWEWYTTVANGPVTDPYSGTTVSSLKALHEVLLQAALQGQSMFAASGDAGAYDANDGDVPPDVSLALSVDNPADDPYITAGGGTTLAGRQSFSLPKKGTFNVTIAHERAWSWDYLEPLCADLHQDPIDCEIFPVGSGGGVSFEFGLPFYQAGIAGMQKTQPNQSFIDEDVIPPQTLIDIPAQYVGRNVPDISFNADPDTGYLAFYTSDKTGFSKGTFWGGTSFVAPQLNGVAALLGEYVNKRLGLLNVAMYAQLRKSGAYSGAAAPFNAIKFGNNDFYSGSGGYNPAVGIGTLNVSNFAEALKHP